MAENITVRSRSCERITLSMHEQSAAHLWEGRARAEEGLDPFSPIFTILALCSFFFFWYSNQNRVPGFGVRGLRSLTSHRRADSARLPIARRGYGASLHPKPLTAAGGA
jgi:hypothetical protein